MAKKKQPLQKDCLIGFYYFYKRNCRKLNACDKSDKQYCHDGAHKRKTKQSEIMFKKVTDCTFSVRFLHLRLSPKCCLARPRRSNALHCR